MQWIIIINNNLYTCALNRVLLAIFKKDIKYEKGYAKSLLKEKIITKQKYDESVNILKDYEIHGSHATLYVTKQNLTMGETQNFNFAITSSSKPVTIFPSLSESLLGETPQTFNVIKIKEGLYITSHSICNALDLKSEQLRYDEDKDCYIEIATNKQFYIMKKDMENMFSVVVNSLESANGVKQIDITSQGDFTNSIVSYKMLELMGNGEFNQETYYEKGQKMNLANGKFNDLQEEYKKLIKSSEPSEEL